MARRLDNLDVQLLNVVQSNNLLTAEEISQRVSLSPSAIMRRLRKLRDGGVIAADVAVLAPEKTGDYLSAIVRVQLERHSDAAVERLRSSLVNMAEVQLCLYVSGPFDMLLLIITRDMQSFNDFVSSRLAEDRAVRRYETEFIKNRWKASLVLPLPDLCNRSSASPDKDKDAGLSFLPPTSPHDAAA